MEDRELYHYGVKGMKWGVRKRRIINRAEGATKPLSVVTNMINKYGGDDKKFNLWGSKKEQLGAIRAHNALYAKESLKAIRSRKKGTIARGKQRLNTWKFGIVNKLTRSDVRTYNKAFRGKGW